MNNIPEVWDLSEEQKALLVDASNVLSLIGAKCIISAHPSTDGDVKFTFIFTQINGGSDMVSGYGKNIAEAFDEALPKYRDYREKPRPITSAVDAVNIIRKRMGDGEDIEAVLADIKVA